MMLTACIRESHLNKFNDIPMDYRRMEYRRGLSEQIKVLSQSSGLTSPNFAFLVFCFHLSTIQCTIDGVGK